MATEVEPFKIIIMTSPSGAGKTTITRHLLKTFSELAFSISATTRSVRNGEEDGVHYHFLTKEDFEQKLEAGEFLESEQVYEGLYYGTLIKELHRLNHLGKVPVLDIDVKGAANIKAKYEEKVFTVFIKPPSLNVLVERLKKRGTESEDELRKRIARMRFELEQEEYFDAVIVNDDLETALKEAEVKVGGFLNS